MQRKLIIQNFANPLKIEGKLDILNIKNLLLICFEISKYYELNID